ncbi:MAG: ParA family protein [Bradyrhizobium icense]|nr:MAG: ParA family protein [Bradyrhizobium icense]
MRTIVLATQKGGSGKTTLAIGLALAALQAGHDVRMIDTDRQGTLSRWQVRRGIAEPLVEIVRSADHIERRLHSFERGGVSLTVIDTASGVGEATMAAIRACDLCMIPTRPTVVDIEATAATLSVVRAWRKPFALILNQAPVRGRRIDDSANALGGVISDLSNVLAVPFIALRNDHQDALAAGLAVSEYAPSGKSADEIQGLWQWTRARLDGAPATTRAAEASALGGAQIQTDAEATAAWKEAGLPWDACL